MGRGVGGCLFVLVLLVTVSRIPITNLERGHSLAIMFKSKLVILTVKKNRQRKRNNKKETEEESSSPRCLSSSSYSECHGCPDMKES